MIIHARVAVQRLTCRTANVNTIPVVRYSFLLRKPHTIFLEMTRDGHGQSDEHTDCSKGNVGETSERRGGAHMGFSERIDSILNWTELAVKQPVKDRAE